MRLSTRERRHQEDVSSKDASDSIVDFKVLRTLRLLGRLPF